jgi:hypothetical protein
LQKSDFQCRQTNLQRFVGKSGTLLNDAPQALKDRNHDEASSNLS